MRNNKAFKIILLSAAFLVVFVCLSFAKTDHREYKSAEKGICQECHGGSGVISNHGDFWLKEHRLLAQKAGSNCTQCHEQSFCLDCHKGGAITPDLQRGPSRRGELMPKTHRSDYISIHSIEASSNPQNCYRCHESNFCLDCHSKTRNKGDMKIKSHRKAGTSQLYNWTSDHSAEARRNLQSCESCHADADVCIQCHSSGKANPHPRNWRDIKQMYKDQSSGSTCRKCHITY
jgi:hypothetical protein